MDVDFIPSSGLLRQITLDYLKSSPAENRALVVPAFEWNNQITWPAGHITNDTLSHLQYSWACDKQDRKVENGSFFSYSLPSSQSELAVAVDLHQAMQFHLSLYPKGHQPTNFTRWWNETTEYDIQYEDGFEPYVVVSKSFSPPYDERFFGYGQCFHTFSL